MTNSFIGALQSGGPASDRADKMTLYGGLIGQWTMDAVVHRDDGSQHRGPGEIHFGWVLEGRAVQDVWIVPPRGELRRGDAAANVNSCGTTLRIYDSSIDAWQIQWTDPVTQNFLHMIGRAEGCDIVQLGTRPDGQMIRWRFSQITPNSFRWTGEISADAGASWRLQVDFSARRVA